MDVGGVGEGVMDDSCMRVVVVVAATGSDSEVEPPLGVVGVVCQTVDKGAAEGSRVGHCVDKLGIVDLKGQSVDNGSIADSGSEVMSAEVAVGPGENSRKRLSGSLRAVEGSYSGNLAPAITAGSAVTTAGFSLGLLSGLSVLTLSSTGRLRRC